MLTDILIGYIISNIDMIYPIRRGDMNLDDEFTYEKQQIANMVKRLRAYAQLSQRDLSKLTGISQADISKLERGIGNPSINTIARIMSATGTSLSFDYKIDELDSDPTIEVWHNLSPKIYRVAKESADMVRESIGDEVEKIILYGSCARGENTEDSDVDIAVLTKAKDDMNYAFGDKLASIAADMMSKYQELVNFVCIPVVSFNEKKDWYPFYKNINEEGIIIYA